MYIKQLEVDNFKSFANKVEIPMLKGFTTISGPNGSGKSNIADAMRWVMGEQSTKTLRGGKMEDVIFSYSDIFPVKTARFANVAFSDLMTSCDSSDFG